MDKWISVEDRLPEYSITVLVCRSNNDMKTAYYFEPNKAWYSGVLIEECKVYNVTHWQPLPDPPQSD